jgi:acyl-CoA dehydrogenase family protein 9
MSVAKNLIAGKILEDSLFPYPALREKDREVLGMMVDAIDQFLTPKHGDFKRWDLSAEQPAEFIQGILGCSGSSSRRSTGVSVCRTPAMHEC